jgi:hypothetical protein
MFVTPADVDAVNQLVVIAGTVALVLALLGKL